LRESDGMKTREFRLMRELEEEADAARHELFEIAKMAMNGHRDPTVLLAEFRDVAESMLATAERMEAALRRG